jgi:hypothetical protein
LYDIPPHDFLVNFFPKEKVTKHLCFTGIKDN